MTLQEWYFENNSINKIAYGSIMDKKKVRERERKRPPIGGRFLFLNLSRTVGFFLLIPG